MALQYFLAGRFSGEFIRTSFWQTDRLKGHILLKHLPICSQLSFESAAIIAEYFSENKEAFVDLLGEPGKIVRGAIVANLKDMWDQRLREFGRDPRNFSDLLMESERAKIMTGLFTREAIEKNYSSVMEAYLAQGEMKIPVQYFLGYLSDGIILEGFGCGLHYPELVRELWHNSYEVAPDKALINESLKYGVLSPEEARAAMEPKPLHQRQIQLLSSVREWVQKHFPGHVTALGLDPVEIERMMSQLAEIQGTTTIEELKARLENLKSQLAETQETPAIKEQKASIAKLEKALALFAKEEELKARLAKLEQASRLRKYRPNEDPLAKSDADVTVPNHL
ncbi:MAG TPA: hypothetical protein VEH30_16665 [Terriglobales bacterium]|nr:hypothetical protein [Terriglobales bacterium]